MKGGTIALRGRFSSYDTKPAPHLKQGTDISFKQETRGLANSHLAKLCAPRTTRIGFPDPSIAATAE